MSIEKNKWTSKDFLGLSVIPIEFLLGTGLSYFSFIKKSPVLATSLSLCIFFTGFLVMITLFRDFLKQEWQLYKKNKFWFKLIVNILLVGGAFLLLNLTRTEIISNLSVNDTNFLSTSSLSLMLLASIQPFIAPFAEELTFRYLLFGKFSNKWLKIIMFFVSSILFGLIHINNFNGNWILTIPYMVIGAYFSTIYFFYKNIWGAIIVHWIFNSINSIIPAIILIIVKIMGVV